MGAFTAVDFAILVLYFLAVLATGLYFWRKSRSVEGFTAAGRSLPGWVVGFSILATYVSSISFLANPGKSFDGNWNPFVFSLSLPIATWVAVKYFIPYYRASNEVSAYSHLEHRFGPWARVYAGVCYLLIQLARMGTVLYLMALPIHVVLGWDVTLIIVATGVCVTAYTFVGGIVAVICTDAIQCIILMAGAVLCLVLMLFKFPEGPGQLFEIANQHEKFSLGSYDLSDFTAPTFWVVLLYGIVINLTNFGIDQNYVQRYIAAKSDDDARKSLWMGGLLFLPLSALFFFIGTTLFAFYQVNPPNFEVKPDEVFARFIVDELPPGLTGLLIAAVFSAAMSTVSTSLNSSATLFMTDWYKRFLNREATEKQQMGALYVSTVVWGVFGTLLAVGIAALENRTVLDTWWVLAGVFSGGMVGIFLLGMVSRRAGNPAGVVAMCVGILVIVWMSVPPLLDKLGVSAPDDVAQYMSSFHSLMIPVVGTLAILLVGLSASQLFPPRASKS